MPLSDVQHQLSAHLYLQRGLAARRVPHALIFAGPPGVGKYMLADRFAAVLLCESPVQAPSSAPSPTLPHWRDACGSCASCRIFAAGNHPDFHRIYRTLNKLHPDKTIRKRKSLDLGIEVIRHFVLDRVSLRPSLGRAKVFIIEESEKLNQHSQNALLKTLEEPPEQTYLILLAAAADVLLPTTRSRCQLVRFGNLPIEFVEQHLRSILRPEHGDPRILAELSGGSPGLAQRYADCGIANRVGAIIATLQTAPEDPLAAGKSIQDISKEIASSLKETQADDDEPEAADDDEKPKIETSVARDAQMTVLALASTILRDIQRCSVGSAPVALRNEPRIPAIARRVSSESIRSGIQALAEAESQIARNVNQALIFDALGIRLARALS